MKSYQLDGKKVLRRDNENNKNTDKNIIYIFFCLKKKL